MTLKEEKIMLNLEKLNDYNRELVINLLEALEQCDKSARLRLIKSTMHVLPEARIPIYENGEWTAEGDVIGALRELIYGFGRNSIQSSVSPTKEEESTMTNARVERAELEERGRILGILEGLAHAIDNQGERIDMLTQIMHEIAPDWELIATMANTNEERRSMLSKYMNHNRNYA
jgi:hypothetical protein